MRSLTAVLAALLMIVPLAGAEEGGTPPQLPELPAVEEGFVMEFPAYLIRLLEKHPELKAARAEARAKAETPSQAESLADPVLSVGVMNLPADSLSFSKEDMTAKTIGVTQEFPAPGKRALRRKVAEAESTSAAAMAREKWLELVEKARLGFYRLRYLMDVRGIAGKNKEILHDFLDVAMTRYEVGEGLQQDVLKAQLEYSKMLEYLIGVDQEISTLQKTLNAWAALPQRTDWRRPVIADMPPITGGADRLIERARANRPLFASLEARLAQAGDSLELARKESTPDYALRFSYGQRDDGSMPRTDLVSAEVMFNLPLYKSAKQDRMAAEAVQMEEKAREDLAAERLKVEETVYELSDRQVRNEKLLALFDGALIMQAMQTAESSRAAYMVNKVDFLTLVTNQITLFDYEIQRAEVAYELMAARVRLQRTLGDDIAEVRYED